MAYDDGKFEAGFFFLFSRVLIHILSQDDSKTGPWPSIVLTHYTQLSRILGRVGEGRQ